MKTQNKPQLTLNQMVAIKRWTNALREGRYPKTVGRLRGHRGYCAVGVGVAVNGFQVEGILSEGSKLLSSVTGIPLEDELDYHSPYIRIALQNDAGRPWSQIADMIEASYLPDGFTIPTNHADTPRDSQIGLATLA